MISFWQQLRTRKIVQWALAYLAGHGEKGAQRVTGPELAMLAGILVIAAGHGVSCENASPHLLRRRELGSDRQP